MPKSALLIIDMQVDFFRQQPRLAGLRESLANSINELIGEFRSHNLPVIWITQEFAPDLSDAPLRVKRDGTNVTIEGTDGCRILPELSRNLADKTIVKKRYSAFFGTDLDSLLAEIRPESLVIAGINAHACVRMTAIDTYQRDHDVILATDGIASYDLKHQEITIAYLACGIARPMTNQEIATGLRP